MSCSSSALSSPGAPDIVRSFPVLFYAWQEGFAPGSKHNNMAAVMEINVSPQIDDLTKGMNPHEEERLKIWQEYPILYWEKDFRRQQRLRRQRKRVVWKCEDSSKLWSGHFMMTFGCDSCWRNRRRWTLWHFKVRWVVLKTYCVIWSNIAIASIPAWIFLWKSNRPESPFSHLAQNAWPESRIHVSGHALD